MGWFGVRAGSSAAVADVLGQQPAEGDGQQGQDLIGGILHNGLSGQHGFGGIVDIEFQLALEFAGNREVDQPTVAEAVGIAVILADHVLGGAVGHIFHQTNQRWKQKKLTRK